MSHDRSAGLCRNHHTVYSGQENRRSKSLKLYFWSFRNEGVFHEHLTNIILDDLVAALSPRWCKVTAQFAVRGGIAISVDAEYPEAGKSRNPKR
ncbi:MAG: hypothetical protein WC883_01820 [Smithellaceae bacterium]